MHEGDFTLHSDHGVGLDWPLSYADLAPHYDRVQTEVGLRAMPIRSAGDRSAPYPMPPLPLFAQSRVLARGFEKPVGIPHRCHWRSIASHMRGGAVANTMAGAMPVARSAPGEPTRDLAAPRAPGPCNWSTMPRSQGSSVTLVILSE
ncbi:MAG: hypothetical protein CM15mP74_09080 [Halieaceae bacterium]|nr:MAG: hypothetical protein CM15mP74_09080 [Halieaceae bacterium]